MSRFILFFAEFKKKKKKKKKIFMAVQLMMNKKKPRTKVFQARYGRSVTSQAVVNYTDS